MALPQLLTHDTWRRIYKAGAVCSVIAALGVLYQSQLRDLLDGVGSSAQVHASDHEFSVDEAEQQARAFAKAQVDRSRHVEEGGMMESEAAFAGSVEAQDLVLSTSEFFPAGVTRIVAPSGGTLDGVRDPTVGTWLFVFRALTQVGAVEVEVVFEDGSAYHLSSTLRGTE